jgi:steroid 5-alpha reductase family enzyme
MDVALRDENRSDTSGSAMSIVRQCLLLLIVMILIMALGWRWQQKRSNAGIVDVLWSIGVGLGAVLMALTGNGAALPRGLVALLGTAWAARLALHLWRRVSHEDEDGRYRQLRIHWRGNQTKFFLFFQFQAGLVVLFSLPFAAVARNPTAQMTLASTIGAMVWLIAIVGEAVADRQLAHFRKNPVNSGKTCRTRLWRYSRHPNYFFEWLHWFAYVALAWESPIAWLAWSGPLVMYIFLRWISGITFTEAQAVRNRGDDYRDYQRTTSMLIPWFPKSTSSDKGTT